MKRGDKIPEKLLLDEIYAHANWDFNLAHSDSLTKRQKQSISPLVKGWLKGWGLLKLFSHMFFFFWKSAHISVFQALNVRDLGPKKNNFGKTLPQKIPD